MGLSCPAVQGAVSVWASTDGKCVILASPSKHNSCWYVVENLASVTGTAAPANGMYIDTFPSPGVGGSTLTAPTSAGTFYGKASTSSCNAATLVATAGNNVAPIWNSSFSAP